MRLGGQRPDSWAVGRSHQRGGSIFGVAPHGVERHRLDDQIPQARQELAKLSSPEARRLGVEQIGLYYLHSGRATDAPFEDQVATLAGLRDEGLIANIGLSNVTLEQFQAAQAIVGVAAVTAHYNPAVRTGAGLLDAAGKAGAVFSPWHPVTVTESGDPHVAEILGAIARRHEATIPQIALAWQLHRSPASLPIPGTTSLHHLRENLAAGTICLTPAEVQAITGLVPES